MRARADVAPCGTKPPKDASEVGVSGDTRHRLRGGHSCVQGHTSTRTGGHLDHARHGGGVLPSSPPRLCPLGRGVVRGTAGGGALRRRTRAPVCGGEHVLSCLRRIQDRPRVVGQAAAALTAHGIDPKEYANKLVYLMGVDKARFRSPVIPDCELHLEIEAIRSHGKVWKYKGTAKVDGKRMADAEWSATIVDRKE